MQRIGLGNLRADDTFKEGQKFHSIPVYDQSIMSYVSWALNSYQYMKDVYQREEFLGHEYVFQNK